MCLPNPFAPVNLLVSMLILVAHPRKKLVADGRVLYRHLLSRKGVTRVQESRRRRGLLRTVPGTHRSPLSLSLSLSLSLYYCMCVMGLFSLQILLVKLWSEKRTESKTKETVESVLRYNSTTLIVANYGVYSACAVLVERERERERVSE